LHTITTERVDSARRFDDIASIVRQGLSLPEKELRPILFYDDRGSDLFERICRTEAYYVTRTEREILQRYAEEMVSCPEPVATLYELGAGNSEKTELLVQAAKAHDPAVAYVANDISEAALLAGAARLHALLPQLELHHIVASYQDAMQHIQRHPAPRLGLFVGGNIGNFPVGEAAEFLGFIRRHAGEHDHFLIGFDLVKDIDRLLLAYDDPEGLTAEFNKNALVRINRELGGNFDVDGFDHRAVWNEQRSRIEMHLVSRRDQTVRIEALGMEFGFVEGETIHTENSHKYTTESFRRLLEGTGWWEERHWMDEESLFCVMRLQAVRPGG
jgi:dimethylhistidine N-methyltransferase